MSFASLPPEIAALVPKLTKESGLSSRIAKPKCSAWANLGTQASGEVRADKLAYHTNQRLKGNPGFYRKAGRSPSWLTMSSAARLAVPSSRTGCSFSLAMKARSTVSSPRVGNRTDAAAEAGNFTESTTPIFDPATGNLDGTGAYGICRQHHSSGSNQSHHDGLAPTFDTTS